MKTIEKMTFANTNAKRNPIARVLSDSRFAKRVVKTRKGRGSYTRKNHKDT